MKSQSAKRIIGFVLTALFLAARVALAGDINDINAVPFLKDSGRAGYSKFLTAEPVRAFAVSENGSWGFGAKRESRSIAVYNALYACNKVAKDICRVYAVNDDIVLDRYATFEQKSRAMIAALKKESIRVTEYGDELRDYRIAATEQIRKDDYHNDTPLTFSGVNVIKTVDVVKLITSDTPPILIDTLEGEGHDTIPGAYWVRGVGLGEKSDDRNAEIRDRFGFLLSGLTKYDKAAPVVLFCLESRCWLSHNAALRAKELGYTNIYWYRGGLKAWKAARLGVIEAVQYGQAR